jgi:hypothetical protein
MRKCVTTASGMDLKIMMIRNGKFHRILIENLVALEAKHHLMQNHWSIRQKLIDLESLTVSKITVTMLYMQCIQQQVPQVGHLENFQIQIVNGLILQVFMGLSQECHTIRDMHIINCQTVLCAVIVSI